MGGIRVGEGEERSEGIDIDKQGVTKVLLMHFRKFITPTIPMKIVAPK